MEKFIAYAPLDGRILKLEIPADAKATGFRHCDKAKILSIEHLNNDINDDKYNVGEFILGEIIIDKNFEENRFGFNDGLELFISREMAANYSCLIEKFLEEVANETQK